MGKRVRKLWMFSWADYRAAEQYLEEQAAKGLLLKKITTVWATENLGTIAVFEKGRPQKRKYCIDMFRTRTEEEAERYLQMSRDAGWEPAAAVTGIVIYISAEGETPVPLQTDWREQYRCARRSFWGFEIPMGIGLLLSWWLIDILTAEKSAGFAVWESWNIGTFFFILVNIFGISCLLRGIGYYLATGIAIRRNVPLRPLGVRPAKFWGGLHNGLCIVLIIAFLVNAVSFMLEELRGGGGISKIFIGIWVLCMIAGLAAIKLEKHIKVKTFKAIFTAIEIIFVIALLAYCATSCEVTVIG